MLFYENIRTGQFGKTLGYVRALYPNVSIPDGIKEYDGWKAYEASSKPEKEFCNVVESAPVNGIQQWKIIEPNDLVAVVISVQKSIDSFVADVIAPFSQFRQMYYDKEKEAEEYRKNAFSGEPGYLLKNFADAANISYKDATFKILKESELFRTVEKEVENLRMKKYSIKPEDGLDNIIYKRDQIFQQLKECSKKVS